MDMRWTVIVGIDNDSRSIDSEYCRHYSKT